MLPLQSGFVSFSLCWVSYYILQNSVLERFCECVVFVFCLFVCYISCIRVFMTSFLTYLCGRKSHLFDFFTNNFGSVGIVLVVYSTVEHANDLDMFLSVLFWIDYVSGGGYWRHHVLHERGRCCYGEHCTVQWLAGGGGKNTWTIVDGENRHSALSCRLVSLWINLIVCYCDPSCFCLFICIFHCFCIRFIICIYTHTIKCNQKKKKCSTFIFVPQM